MNTINLSQINDWVKKNQGDIALVVGFVLVAIISFGAGRLSAPEIIRNPIVIEEPSASSSINIFGSVSQSLNAPAGDPVKAPSVLTGQASAKGLFVVSRGGKKYHWPWCSWAKKIKPENQVWFNSEAEAQKAGYSPCACIVSKAPAGYQKN